MNWSRLLDVGAAPRVAWARVLLRHARRVRRETGKGVIAQLAEVAVLRLGPGRLRPMHYYHWEIHDDARYPWARKREFIDWPVPRLGGRVNDIQWRAVSRDKLAMYAFFAGNAIPHPRVIAFYHPGGRRSGTATCLPTPEAVGDYLRTRMAYPFFGKPVNAAHGRGASLVEGYDASRDRLCLPGGESVAVDAYVRDVVQRAARRAPALGSADGYLFQDAIRQHAALRPIVGERVCTLRVVALVHDDGPRVFRAIWRIASAANITDNYVDGRTGNLLGVVDCATGVIRRAIHGLGHAPAAAEPSGGGTFVDVHPETGARLVGLRVPCWDEVTAFVCSAAAVFPRIRYQSWDIALTDEGPVAVELNFFGDYVQPGQERGFYDPEMQEFLARYGS